MRRLRTELCLRPAQKVGSLGTAVPSLLCKSTGHVPDRRLKNVPSLPGDNSGQSPHKHALGFPRALDSSVHNSLAHVRRERDFASSSASSGPSRRRGLRTGGSRTGLHRAVRGRTAVCVRAEPRPRPSVCLFAPQVLAQGPGRPASPAGAGDGAARWGHDGRERARASRILLPVTGEAWRAARGQEARGKGKEPACPAPREGGGQKVPEVRHQRPWGPASRA